MLSLKNAHCIDSTTRNIDQSSILEFTSKYIKLYNGKNITNTDNILHNCTDLYLLNFGKQKEL